ncbi:MAG: type II secretion system protein GspG [Planctomycetaceae bacterium]|jgi:type II secretion system protein G|nr:type II secretion system protein GspG [Planctomycetaceae bacterium]
MKTKTMKTMLLNWKRQRGFTLIELLIVLAILVVIMALLLPGLFRRWTNLNIDATKIQISKLEQGLNEYNIHTGTYPLTAQGLEALITRPQMPGVGGGLTSPTIPANTMPGNPPSSNGFPANGQPNGFDALQNPQQQGFQQPNQAPPFGNPNNSGTMNYAPQGQIGQMPNMGGAPGIGTDPTMNNGGIPGMGTDSMMNNGGIPGMGTDPTMNNGGIPGTEIDSMMNGGVTPGMTSGNPGGYDQRQLLLAQKAINKWRGPYLDPPELPLDPWNRPFHYEYPTTKTYDGKPAIWSDGPDEKPDTPDDIGNFGNKEETEEYRQKFQQNQPQTGINSANPIGAPGTPNSPMGNNFGGYGNGIGNGTTPPGNAGYGDVPNGYGGAGISPPPSGYADPANGAGYGGTGIPPGGYGNPQGNPTPPMNMGNGGGF